MSKHKNKVGVEPVVTKVGKKLYYLYILDRSGSMACVQQQTVDNVNEQINVIKDVSAKEGVESFVTVLLFDQRGSSASEWFEYLFTNKPVGEVEHITVEQYVPHGGTPLRDAIGIGVQNIQTQLGDTLGSPDVKVLVTAFTDGAENSSVQFSSEQIKSMIEHLSSDGKFVFTFVGAGSVEDVTRVSSHFGVAASNTMAYTNDLKGHKLSSKSMSRGLTSFVSSYASDKDVALDFFANSPKKEEEEPAPTTK